MQETPHGDDNTPESLFWFGPPSWFAETGKVVFGIILFLLGILFIMIAPVLGILMLFIAIVLGIASIWHHLSTRYRVTNQHITYRQGIIFIKTEEVKIRDIRAIRTHANILCGAVELATAGTLGYEVRLLGLPLQVTNDIKAYLDKLI